MLCFDLHEEFGFACILKDGQTARLLLNDVECRHWFCEAHPYIREVRWFEKNQVIVWSDAFNAAIVSSIDWHTIAVGFPDKVLVSKTHLFVSHDEETVVETNVLRPSNKNWEREVLAVFNKHGEPILGLDELLTANQFNEGMLELNAAYIDGEVIVFNAYDSDHIYKLNISEKTLVRFSTPFSTVMIHHLSGNVDHAIAIFDNRRLLPYYPDRIPFELAVFDLVTETSAKQDFAPVEKKLIAAGFKMDTLKFQPSSTGKINVSDGQKAAFLELSDDV